MKTNERIYKTETYSQTKRMNLCLPGEKGAGEGDRLVVWNWHVHTAIFKIDKDLL